MEADHFSLDEEGEHKAKSRGEMSLDFLGRREETQLM